MPSSPGHVIWLAQVFSGMRHPWRRRWLMSSTKAQLSTVGRPLGLVLTRRSENATVTLCHTGTKDLGSHVKRADIVVAAAGVRGLITADMVKPGAAVLDVGVSRTDIGIAGDVAPEVAEVAGWLAPMPGGVGPMTRALLLTNVVEAAERAAGLA